VWAQKPNRTVKLNQTEQKKTETVWFDLVLFNEKLFMV
jgi:hypothetical protein